MVDRPIMNHQVPNRNYLVIKEMRWLVVLAMYSLLFLEATRLSAGENPAGFLKRYYSVDAGLSQSEVTSIVKDKYGFMWFGTRGGLNRFDGYSFVQFKPKPGQLSGLQDPSVETMLSDHQDNLWIGTKSGGLSIYSISKSAFIPIGSWAHKLANRIISFCEDREGHYWIGSWANGVFEYDPDQDTLKNYLANARVLAIVEDKEGTLWMGTTNGLMYKKSREEVFQHASFGPTYMEITEMALDPTNSCIWMVGWGVGLIRYNYSDQTYKTFRLPLTSGSAPNTYSLLCTGDNKIWVGSWGGGLFRFDASGETFLPVILLPPDINKKSSDYDIILEIFKDETGDIWIGTDGGGVIRLSERRDFVTLSAMNNQISDYWHINSVYTSKDSELWIGTRANGLFVTRDYKQIEKIPFSYNSLHSGVNPSIINVFYPDRGGNLWVGMDRGLFIISTGKNGKRELEDAASFFQSSDLAKVRKVNDIEEYGSELWVATQQQGLFIFQKKEDAYHLKKKLLMSSGKPGFQVERISTLDKDKEGNKWIGTYKGLYRMANLDSIPRLITDDLTEGKSLLCDIILCCSVSDSDRVWFGTPCSLNCLEKMNDGKYNLKQYTRENGLTDDYINAIEIAGEYIWFSTNLGISRLRPATGEITNFDVSDGIGGTNFSEHSSCRSVDGILYFGGYSDLTFFHPDNIGKRDQTAGIVITSLKVMNQEILPRDEKGQPVSVNEVKKLKFNHKEKEFSFEIASLDYKSPANNRYAYRLTLKKGTGDWVQLGQRRHISFNNLKPGEYILSLAGTNSNGLWNPKKRELQIKILPPPWETWYAFLFYTTVLLAIMFMINRVYLREERLKNEARIEHIQRINEHELNEAKLSFFTEITHEIKTPLTLIQGPIDELMNRNYDQMDQVFFNNRITLIRKNTEKLIEMIGQLLEFRKVEAGKSVLQASENDLKEFISGIFDSYLDLAARKSIRLVSDFRINNGILWFEPSKMYIIVTNLLSNAFKYSGKPGKVTLSLWENEQEIVLSVANNGEGLDENTIPRLFDRYYQAPGKKQNQGSGIGLYLVKHFVEMHHGKIFVNSHPGVETVFRLVFLKGKDHLKQSEIARDEMVALSHHTGLSADGSFDIPFKQRFTAPRGSKILVVEDNSELREYLVQLLGEHYEVLEAADGISGYDAAITHFPDLVVSDVIMTGSDGYELCSRIKKNEITSHIPVILLTEKNREQDQLLGTRLGADAYLTKPFTPTLLLEQIKQQIALRTVLEKKYRRKMVLEPQQTVITSDEEKMITSVMKVIEKNISHPDLDSDFIAASIGMSSSTFYRKIKKTLHLTPADFIRQMRMKVASKYLLETSLTITEISEKTGYADIKSFRSSFQSVYGISPAEYRKTHS